MSKSAGAEPRIVYIGHVPHAQFSCRSGPVSVQAGVQCAQCNDVQLYTVTTITDHDQTWTSIGTVTLEYHVTDAANNATCVSAHYLTTACPYVSCMTAAWVTPMAPMLVPIWLLVAVVVLNCMLLVQPTLTCTASFIYLNT